MKILHNIQCISSILESLYRSFRLAMVRRISKGLHSIETPNDPKAWEEVCLRQPIEPVRSITSPEAKTMIELSSEDDILLEAGCGWASNSAQIALSNRRICLCDFSVKILERASQLFEVSGLPAPKTLLCDLTRPWPFPDQSFDIVWSSGVLEHWTDEELVPILKEMARVSRKGVISMVPNAGSLLYRMGKYLAEKEGVWPYGRELPRHTLRPLFESAGLRVVREFTIWPEIAPTLLSLTDPVFSRLAADWWSSLAPDDPVRTDQGYLLVTVGLRA